MTAAPNTGTHLVDAALAAHHAGLCVVPPTEDGAKRPDVDEWKTWQERLPTEAEVRGYYANGRTGLGIVCGAISGGVELFDFDCGETWLEYQRQAEDAGLSYLLARVEDGYLEKTPNGGVHLFYYCPAPCNGKLARRPKRPDEQLAPKDTIKTLIETKGEKGYAVTAPSHGRVHASGKPYELVRGGFGSIARITSEERELLHELARTFDETRRPLREDTHAETRKSNGELRPGDDFNARAPWPEVLEPHGWRRVFEHGGKTAWRRPGKTEGVSATTNHQNTDLFYPFTSSTEFEPERGYSKFSAFAILNHGGDFKAAASELGRRGYGGAEREIASEVVQVAHADPRHLFDGAGLVVPRLGDEIRAQAQIKLGIDGRLYRYAAGVYRGDGEPFARMAARRLLGDLFKRRHLDEVLAFLRADLPEVKDQQPDGLLNLRNGLLEWGSDVLPLRDHEPEILSTIQIPHAWKPGAKCPRIEAFIKQVIPEDAATFIMEVIGYALLAANPLRVAVLLLGPGRNGKSVLLLIVKALLGAENVSAVPLQVLAENRFAAAELFGKLANICGDLDARAIKQTDIFKMLTGGDPMPGERKHRDLFMFTPFALPLFSANEPPLSSDQSAAWFDRWLVVPMENRIAENEVDPKIIDKLTTRAELEGLLVLAVGGLRRLMRRGRFDLPESVKGARIAYRERLDTVLAFVTEECEIATDTWTKRSLLYQHYRTWAVQGGRLPVSVATFNSHLRAGYGEQRVVEKKTDGGIWGWQGLRLRVGS